MFCDDDFRLDKPNEECGIFGVFSQNSLDVARVTYYALYALQHRGQESSGIAVNDSGTIVCHRDMGLVNEVFNDVVLNHLKGSSAIGHVRYSTTGASLRENAQPMAVKYISGQFAVAHNGNLVNSLELRKGLEEKGALFQTSIDSEVIANLIARGTIGNNNIVDSIKGTMKEIKGSYALVILTADSLIGVRDPLGIRPLCVGKLKDSYVFASETCALDAVGAEFIRDIRPGEIVIADKNGLRSILTETSGETKLCVFEFIYFARPDSYIEGVSVYEARKKAGQRLAIEHPVDADLVIGVPDSGLSAAIGYSMQSGIPFDQGLMKNRYTGRTFIQPEQLQRENGVRIKLNPMKSTIEGKRIVLVEDSIVRGTTIKWIIQLLRSAKVKEIHMRVASPSYKYPCYFGIDVPSNKTLIASANNIEKICKMVGADSLGYISQEGLLETLKDTGCGFCTACFDGKYPMDVPKEADKLALQSVQLV